MQFSSLEDILYFVIELEQKAFDFYTIQSRRMTIISLRKLMEEIAHEEFKHKLYFSKTLETIKEFNFSPINDTISFEPLHLLTDIEINYNIENVLRYAINTEKEAFEFYMKLASNLNEKKLKDLFISFALEESRHQKGFQYELDEYLKSQS